MTTPNETYESDSYYDNLAGTTDSNTGIPYIPATAGPNSSPSVGVWRRRRDNRIFGILKSIREGMVVKEGSLKIGIWPINYLFKGMLKTYSGATNESVTDNATNYVYIDDSNNLIINTSGFPATNDYLPLAEVICANGSISAITDKRDTVIFAVGTDQIADESVGTNQLVNAAVTEAKLASSVAGNGLTGGSGSSLAVNPDNSTIEISGDTVQVKDNGIGTAKIADNSITEAKLNTSVAGDGLAGGGGSALSVNVDDSTLEISSDTLQVKDNGITNAKLADDAVDTAKLSDTVADAISQVTISVGSESSDTIPVTVQVQDIQGNNLSGNYLIRAWLADSQYGAECTTAPNSGTSWTTGTVLETTTSDKRWLVITDNTGKAVIDVSDTGTPTFYLNVEIDGKVYASSAITFS